MNLQVEFVVKSYLLLLLFILLFLLELFDCSLIFGHYLESNNFIIDPIEIVRIWSLNVFTLNCLHHIIYDNFFFKF